MLNIQNQKEISKPLTIRGIPRENIAISGIISILSLNISNFIICSIVFIMSFAYLSYLTKKDIDIVKVFLKKLEVGKTYRNNKGKNFYVR